MCIKIIETKNHNHVKVSTSTSAPATKTLSKRANKIIHYRNNPSLADAKK